MNNGVSLKDYLDSNEIKELMEYVRYLLGVVDANDVIKYFDSINSYYVIVDNKGEQLRTVSYDVNIQNYDKVPIRRVINDKIVYLNIRKLHENENKDNENKFSLKKYINRGTAITIAGIIALVGFEAVALNKKKNSVVTKPVAIVEHVNTIADASDVLLLTWVDYAMKEINDSALNNEDLNMVAESIYNNLYTKVMTYYNDYLYLLNSGMPREIIASTLNKAHDLFRKQVYLFDESLKVNFSAYSFVNTPYSDAIVCDFNDNVVSNGTYFGERIGNDGQVLIYDENDEGQYNVLVKALDVQNNDYQLDSLPSDAIIYNGQVYVTDSHLDDFKNDVSSSKSL